MQGMVALRCQSSCRSEPKKYTPVYWSMVVFTFCFSFFKYNFSYMNCILFAYFLPKWYGLLVHFGQCHRKNMPVECHYLELSLIVVYKSRCRSISQYGKKKKLQWTIVCNRLKNAEVREGNVEYNFPFAKTKQQIFLINYIKVTKEVLNLDRKHDDFSVYLLCFLCFSSLFLRMLSSYRKN